MLCVHFHWFWDFFKNSLWLSLLTHWFFRSVLFSFHIFLDFPYMLLLISSFISLCSDIWYNFDLLKFAKTCLCPIIWSFLEYVSCAPENKLLDRMFCICLLSPFDIRCRPVFSCWFTLWMINGWSIHCWEGSIEVPYYYCIVYFFLQICVCLIYLGALMLGVCIFTIVISSWCINPCVII